MVPIKMLSDWRDGYRCTRKGVNIVQYDGTTVMDV